MSFAPFAGIRRIGAVAAVLALATAAGCGGGDAEATGSVSGKVTFKDQPVTEGTVSLYDEKQGTAGGGKIESNGAYRVIGLKAGEYKASVSPPMDRETSSDPNNPPKPKDMPNIPEKYRKFETSGLSITVKDGTNELNVNMTE